MHNLLGNLHLSFGPTMPSLARIHACLPVEIDIPNEMEFSGEIIGPRCRFARTLESMTPFRRLTPRHHFFGEAVLPDPCFWSDEVPMLYTAHFRLQQAGVTMEAARIDFGIPAIDADRGASIFRQGKRWVPRGVVADASSFAHDAPTLKEQLSAWRDASAVLCVAAPSDELCAAASEWGIWMIAEIDQGDEPAICRELARLARHAAVFMAILPRDFNPTDNTYLVAPNVVQAAQRENLPDFVPEEVLRVADCVVLEADDPTYFSKQVLTRPGIPILARRRHWQATDIQEARRECDRLQADLAPIGDFAGYLIDPISCKPA